MIRNYDIQKFGIYRKILLILALFFYAAILAVKWPDAMVAFCVFLMAHYTIKKKYTIASLFLAIGYNFRSEMLSLLLLYIFIVFLVHKQLRPALAVVLLIPWIVAIYIHYGKLVPTSTNMGGVLYNSLGQLPNNPWNRICDDKEVMKFIYIKTNGRIKDPWSIEGNNIFKKQFYTDISKHPMAFVEKLGYNLFTTFTTGLYRYEYINYFITKDEIDIVKEKYSKNLGMLVSDVFLFKKEAIVTSIQKGIGLLSRIVWLALCFEIVRTTILNRNIREILPMLILILAQIAVCVAIISEPRHLSKILGIFILLLCYSSQEEQSDAGKLMPKNF